MRPRIRTSITCFCTTSITCFCTLLFGVCVQVPLHSQVPTAPRAGTSTQDTANDLIVGVGKSVLVDSIRPVERIALGSSDLAEATAVSPSEVMLNGKAPGETSLIIWQAGGGRQFFNVKVHPSQAVANDRLDGLRRELRTEFPGQPIRATSEGGVIFLRGNVKDLESSDRAVQIASTAGKVVNLLYVTVPTADPQIMLKVRFASLDRTLSNQLGINIFSTGAANTIGSVTTGQFSPPTLSNNGNSQSATAPFNLSNLLNLFIFRPDIDLGATIQALENNGVLQVLAEPNVLTANGKQGSFLAGGQFPYPVVQGVTGGTGAGAVTIQFKEFGVRLDFIPTITPRGTIHLQVAPEVSSLDFANGVTISGFTVPAINTRKVQTEVELGEGQSFAIGGLLDQRDNKTMMKIPFLGDVPVLGKFFQSVSKTKTNTELIVIVTPEIVSPLPAGAPLPELKYPDAFLPIASGIPMTTPQPPGPKQAAVAPAAVPVGDLVRSMQPERPLVINSTSPGAIYSSPQGSSGISH